MNSDDINSRFQGANQSRQKKAPEIKKIYKDRLKIRCEL